MVHRVALAHFVEHSVVIAEVALAEYRQLEPVGTATVSRLSIAPVMPR